METAVVLRRGTGKGKSFLACTLRDIFRVTSDDLVISLPMGVSFNPQPQGQVLHDERRGQTCAHTCAHTRTHVVRPTRLSVFIHCAQWRVGAVVLACLQDGQPQARESLSAASLSFCSG